MTIQSYPARLAELAARHPDREVVVLHLPDGTVTTLTWAALDQRSTRFAHLLAAAGVDSTSRVVVGLPTSHEHVVAAHGAWKLGALVIPVNDRMPVRERDELLAIIAPKMVVGNWDDVSWPTVSAARVSDNEFPDTRLPDSMAHPGEAIPSGGSTGRPKIIIPDKPLRYDSERDLLSSSGMREGHTQLVPGALYYSLGFNRLHHGVMYGHRIILMERFDAVRAADIIEQERVTFMATVPTVMRRLIELPDLAERDFSSIECLYHTGAPCPPWVKRAWIEAVGPEHVLEGFGSSEAVGRTQIRGDEWLEHPGSVGRPWECELKIVDEEGNSLPNGEVGQVWTRPTSKQNSGSTYLGTKQLEPDSDGFYTVGDLGWIDDDGYVYFADRRVDMILSGGANVFPAEVEASLVRHPLVADVAVIGLDDPDWGRRVHAVVELTPAGTVTEDDLDEYARVQLASYKVPKSYEFIETLPREISGKIRRSALVTERS